MNKFLFKKDQEKADKQLQLIEDRKLKIRKDLYMMYFLYLSHLRSEFFNYTKKAIFSLEKSKTLVNLSKKEIRSLIVNDINPLINESLPFLTIEQLTLTKYSFQNKPLRVNNFQKKDLDIDAKSFYKDNCENYSLNISSECKYYNYSLLEKYDLNSSIDLDNFNLQYENSFDYYTITDKPHIESAKNEKIINGTLIDFDLLKNNQENYKNPQIFEEISNLLNWTEWLDFSLSCQLKKITNQINTILFLKKIIKKKITNEFLDYVSDNNFLITNPFPFINLFDLNNKEFINFDNFEPNPNYSKIYFFNLNITEIEFFDMNLNINRNKITDLKYQLDLLIKKEKYWNNKKLYAKRNKSTINEI